VFFGLVIFDIHPKTKIVGHAEFHSCVLIAKSPILHVSKLA